jgi:hypothetical protein
VAKLLRDCCAFDLKQALDDSASTMQSNTLDNDCFSALASSIGTLAKADIEQETFCNWVRTQFPTLFYGLEMWLRKQSTESTNASASVCGMVTIDAY